jgi:hypothetical protein
VADALASVTRPGFDTAPLICFVEANQGCDAFLTNDGAMSRVGELDVLVLSELRL